MTVLAFASVDGAKKNAPRTGLAIALFNGDQTAAYSKSKDDLLRASRRVVASGISETDIRGTFRCSIGCTPEQFESVASKL